MFHPQDPLPVNANTKSSPTLSQLVMDSPYSAYQNKLLSSKPYSSSNLNLLQKQNLKKQSEYHNYYDPIPETISVNSKEVSSYRQAPSEIQSNKQKFDVHSRVHHLNSKNFMFSQNQTPGHEEEFVDPKSMGIEYQKKHQLKMAIEKRRQAKYNIHKRKVNLKNALNNEF